MIGQDAQVIIDGKLVDLGMTPDDPLVRSVMISLFTWRRATPEDGANLKSKWGWWGDTFPVVSGSKIGSRLWLLAREKMTQETYLRAEEYAREALQWLLDDGVASAIEVKVERGEIDRLDLWIKITRVDGVKVDLRFAELWSRLNV